MKELRLKFDVSIFLGGLITELEVEGFKTYYYKEGTTQHLWVRHSDPKRSTFVKALDMVRSFVERRCPSGN